MFESEYFSLPMALVYLLKREGHSGVQAYLVNKLYNYSPEEVTFYLPQIVNLVLNREESGWLETYLLDKAADSYLFALNLYWHLHSKLDSKRFKEKVDALTHDCEMTLVNGVRPMKAKTATPPDIMLPIKCNIEETKDSDFAYTHKQHRNDFFILQYKFLLYLAGISITLIEKDASVRESYLRASLQTVNQVIDETREKHKLSSNYVKRLFRGVVLPATFCEDPDDTLMQVVRVPYEFADYYKTKCRVPYKVYLEMVSINESMEEVPDFPMKEESIPETGTTESQPPAIAEEIDGVAKVRRVERLESMKFEGLPEFAEKVEREEKEGVEIPPVVDVPESQAIQTDPHPDKWSTIVDTIRSTSPFGGFKTWKLRAFIVKGEDDLRQELLAMQVIKKVSAILKTAGSKAFLRPYEIYVVSDNAGLIEYIPDSQSISNIHKEYRTLLEYYTHTWEQEFQEAQKNFVESLAGYSLICYLLNIKDRHNGNILVDAVGHIIHIDFGFFLTSSPGGNINFETAPFKLTREMVEMMQVQGSEIFNYFKVLLLQGFLELRKHKEELMLLVEMMMSAEPLGCFVNTQKVIRELDERFHQNKTDEQCMRLVDDLVNQASENWRTVKYDSFQRYSNGIL